MLKRISCIHWVFCAAINIYSSNSYTYSNSEVHCRISVGRPKNINLRAQTRKNMINNNFYTAPELTAIDIDLEASFCQSPSNDNSINFAPNTIFGDEEEEL